MPERPDLDYVVPCLDRELRGVEIVGQRVRKSVVMRALTPVVGVISLVRRRAHTVVFEMGANDLVISPMLAGRFQIDGKPTADLAVAWSLSDGRELRYRDDVQMGKVYWLARGGTPPGLDVVGVDVLSAAFTLDHLRTLTRGRRDQVKVFLMDKSALDALGNAYADEALWEAGIHPKRTTTTLNADEVERLHGAIVRVIRDATATIAERAPPLHEKLRDFLHVRGRIGSACDRCSTALRTTGVHGHDAYFCPRCQPDSAHKGFVDWRKLPPAPG